MLINFFAGPGAGKSTLAAGLFHHLKTRGISTELVREFAKDIVWEKRFHMLEPEYQIYIFAEQLKRLSDVYQQVDIVVTDSPLLLSLVYHADKTSPTFKALVLEEFEKFDNMNFVLNRKKEFVQAGRVETVERASALDKEIVTMLTERAIPYEFINPDLETVLKVLDRNKAFSVPIKTGL